MQGILFVLVFLSFALVITRTDSSSNYEFFFKCPLLEMKWDKTSKNEENPQVATEDSQNQ